VQQESSYTNNNISFGFYFRLFLMMLCCALFCASIK